MQYISFTQTKHKFNPGFRISVECFECNHVIYHSITIYLVSCMELEDSGACVLQGTNKFMIL